MQDFVCNYKLHLCVILLMGLDDDDRYIKDSRHKVPKLHIRYLNHFLKFFYIRKYVDSQAEIFSRTLSVL